jgi:Tol biopolymer transport system component
MPLQPGQRVAHYDVVEKIGEGGMGEVYRATDTRLGRDVAIKALPADVANDPERLTRFQREAQVLASLNHANIAAIHGLEEVEGASFLVLELVAGPDLSDWLQTNKPDVAETLKIARQIAEALEQAHEQGIVHRDLKPANVKLTPDGKVKVLDFGLAKALETAPDDQVNPAMSPTLTAAATRAGVIMGTAAYMSPEQARGSVVDKRADIWAFGCVLLEMLTGRNTFKEKTVSDTLASVLRSDPNFEELPDDVPRTLDRLLRRCLEKDASLRLRDIGEARIAIDRILSGAEPEEAVTVVEAPASSSRRWIWITAAAVLVTAIITVNAVKMLQSPLEESGIRRFEIFGEGLETDLIYLPVLSPDARSVVYASDDRLWIRDLQSLVPRELSGTEGAAQPAWSPDGDYIAFGRDESLWKVPVQGGEPSAIAIGIGEIGSAGRIAWGPDGRIVYARGGTGLYEVSSRGGAPKSLYEPDPETADDLHDPSFLPDGSGILFVTHRAREGPDTITALADGKAKDLLQIDDELIRKPFYAPTGHLFFTRRTASAGLWAAPFSLSDLEVTGEPFLVDSEGSNASAAAGALLYVRGVSTGLEELTWVDRKGEVVGTIGQPHASIAAQVLSPDGRRVAIMGRDNEGGDIWIHDVEGGTRTRLTFTKRRDWDPAWTPDGAHILFWDGDARAIARKAADGTGETEILVSRSELNDSGTPVISPDGKTMVFWAEPALEAEDLWVKSLDSDEASVPLMETPAREEFPRFSPDGKYLAYVSDESGRGEIYLTRFPSVEGKWQISSGGGSYPVWSRNGDRIFYLERTVLTEVDVVTEPAVRIGSPRTLFDAAAAGYDVRGTTARFDVALDGESFLLVRPLKQEGVNPSLVLVENWATEFE